MINKNIKKKQGKWYSKNSKTSVKCWCWYKCRHEHYIINLKQQCYDATIHSYKTNICELWSFLLYQHPPLSTKLPKVYLHFSLVQDLLDYYFPINE
jgi:hypothetical protein